MSSLRPKRRSTTHVETLHGELCIYEWTTRTVHALNPAAARVWDMCDGSATVEEMVTAVRRDLNAPGAQSIIAHALSQFDRAGLLEPESIVGAGALVSRRALLRRIGVAAAIPVVTSIVAPSPAAAQSSRTARFTLTGAVQFFTVPAGVTALQVDVIGAQGAGNIMTATAIPGLAGQVQATLPVTPGEVLTIMVGGGGGFGSAGGFNGGGSAGVNGNGGGGGASDIRRGSTRLIVAGGGGGFGATGANGGNGGGLVGAFGLPGSCGCGGQGGTQSTGGAGGSCPGTTSGLPGTSGIGGAGANGSPGSGGAGGGGGYFGGGGGGGGTCVNGGAGGGGGSSFADPSATSVVHTQGTLFTSTITLNW